MSKLPYIARMHLEHIPVLATEVLDLLSPQPGDAILDVTLGLGGHAELFLNALSDTGTYVGIDADERNMDYAKERLKGFQNVTYLHANFADLETLELGSFDCILADLGVSSPHFDDPERGFTFREDAPLDMRYDTTVGIPVSAWILHHTEEELADVLFHYGELHQSRKLAAVIQAKSPQTTQALAESAKEVLGFRTPSLLPQVFQALRIVVNRELEALETLLRIGPHILNPGGKLAIMSYHSLEDRMVKHEFKSLCTAEKDEHTGQDLFPTMFELLTKKAVVPSAEEISGNPRARSAKLRILRKKS